MRLRIFNPLAWPLGLKLLATALSALLPALVPLAAALAAFLSLLGTQHRIERAAAQLQTAEETLRLVFEAQSAVRGFVLTGSPILLAPFETADREIAQTLHRLADVETGETVQLWRAERVSRLYFTWRDRVALSIVQGRRAIADLPAADPRRGEMLAAIETRIRLREGLTLTDEIRWLIRDFSATEQSQLDEARLAGAKRRRTLIWLVAGGLPAALLTGLLSALLLARRATRSLSRLTDAASKIEHGELPEPVVYQGRDELTRLARAFNRMLDRERSRRREHEALVELDDLLQSSASLAEATDLVATVAPRLLGSMRGALYFYDSSRVELERAAFFGPGAAELPQRFAPETCWGLRLARPHRALQTHVPRCTHLPERGAASLCLPLAANGQIFGLFVCASTEDASADADGTLLATAETLAERLALQFAALRLREDLRHQSIRDPLTGVFNRRYFDETFERELRRAERNGSKLALLIADLDHFKRFNDTFGHEAGDLVLREFGALLNQVFRAGDLPCRLGGEEFVVLLPDADVEGVRHRVEELTLRLRNRQLHLRKQALGTVTLSAGLAEYPAHGRTTQELLRAADDALYSAKNAGRDRYLVAS